MNMLDDGDIDFAIIEGAFRRDQYASIPLCVDEYIPIGSKE